MPKSGDINPDHGHLTALDGVRGLAVLMVMSFHFLQRETFPSSRVVNLLQSISRVGQTGVDLFFVLSGFLITGILLHAKQSPAFFRNFYARRALRIFPLAYGALLVVYVVLPLAGLTAWTSWKQQLWFWLYASNLHATFSTQDIGGPGHFWSLAVEEQFYLTWPTVVWLCNRRSLYGACIGCLIISLAARLVLIKLDYTVFDFTLCRLDALAMGAILANFVRDRRGFAVLESLRPQVWLGTTFLLLVPLWINLTGKHEAIAQIAKYPLISLL
ncbi:MAG: acyltransferase, partial [Tepidisphaeraceae bacterium]